jgi:hypothetical protein
MSVSMLNLPQAVNKMTELLQSMRDELRNLRANQPTPRPANRVYLLQLSSAGSTQARQLAIEGHITGVIVGGDQSGKATLQIGTWLIPIWMTSMTTNFLSFREDDQIVVKNDRITFVNPGNTGSWDLTLFIHPRPANMQAPAGRV